MAKQQRSQKGEHLQEVLRRMLKTFFSNAEKLWACFLARHPRSYSGILELDKNASGPIKDGYGTYSCGKLPRTRLYEPLNQALDDHQNAVAIDFLDLGEQSILYIGFAQYNASAGCEENQNWGKREHRVVSQSRR